MVNPSAHNTINAKRHVGGLTVWELIGAYNTVEGNVDAYNTVCVRVVAEYCTGYGPWYRGLTCAPWLAFSVSPLVPSERASPIGCPQSALVAPVGEER